MKYIKEILYLIGKDGRKAPFVILLFFILSVLDVVGLSLIGPYIALLVDPNSMQSGVLNQLIISIGLPKDQKELLFILGVALLSVFLIKAFFSIGINYLIIQSIENSV